MLQQTRVETVIPYYERFLERFPTLRALATADEESVLEVWAGLGYYSRARSLRRAAERVVAEHGGELPRDRDALLALPGVGPYTAGALRSIAFDEPAGLVDGNVTRVLARLRAETRPEPAQTWRLAESLVPRRRPGDFNQALMELGATVCTPRAPDCPACPLRRDCAAHATGTPERFPAPRKRPAVRAMRAVCGILRRGDALLMLRRPSRGLLGGLWEVPTHAGEDPVELVREIRERTGVRARPGRQLGTVEHAFTHRALRLDVYRLRRDSDRIRLAPGVDARWCTPAEREALALSKLMRKTLDLAGRGSRGA
jgi:A/G-specific adenine glycosylase